MAALVHGIDAAGIDLTLANLHPMEGRRLIVQAGAFGEHAFTEASYRDAAGKAVASRVDGQHLEVELGPGTVLDLRLGMERFGRQPSYRLPWDG